MMLAGVKIEGNVDRYHDKNCPETQVALGAELNKAMGGHD
jgi:hypothetical protein